MTNNFELNLDTKKSIEKENKNKVEKLFISFPNPLDKNIDLVEDIQKDIKTTEHPSYRFNSLDSSIVSPKEIEFNKKEFKNKYENVCRVDSSFYLKHGSEDILNKMLNISNKYTQDFKTSCYERVEKYSEKLIKNNSKIELTDDEMASLKKIIEKSKSKDLDNEKRFSDNDIDLLKKINEKSPKYKHNEINNLITNIEKLQNGENIITEQYNEAVSKVKCSIEILKSEIKNIPEDLQNGFTKVLGGLIHEYEKALESGNEVRISMYSTLISKIIYEVKQHKSGEEIYNHINEYRSILSEFKNELITDVEKINIIKSYIGDEKYNLVERYLESNSDKIYAQEEDTHDNLNNEKTFKTKEYKIVFGIFINLGGIINSKGTFIDPPQIINNDNLIELKKISSKEIRMIVENCKGFKKALYDFDDNNKKLDKIQNIISEIICQSLNINISNKSDKVIKDNRIDEIINKLIEEAENMELNLDLSFNDDELGITELLEKFREIIVNLDKNIREDIRKNIENLLITKKHIAYMQDMELRWKCIDKVKEEINFLFNELIYDKF